MLGMIYGAWAGIALGLAVRNCCVDCCMYLLLVASCILLHGIIALSLLPQSPVQLGSFLFRATVKQRSFARLDISADFDENIPEPSTGGHVSKKLAKILGFTDEWVRMPDYQRVRLQQSADGTVGYHLLCARGSVSVWEMRAFFRLRSWCGSTRSSRPYGHTSARWCTSRLWSRPSLHWQMCANR